MAKDKAKKQDKSKNTAKELREKLSAQLENDLKVAKKDLLELQKSLAANELANPHAVKKMRREIARIKTILTEKSKSNNESEVSTESGKQTDDKKGAK